MERDRFGGEIQNFPLAMPTLRCFSDILGGGVPGDLENRLLLLFCLKFFKCPLWL